MKLAAEEECKGFLLTCQQNREKQAIRDAYNFLGEFIDRLYPNLSAGSKEIASLEDEIKEMQNKKSRVLFSIQTNVKCCIFIKINPEFTTVDPCKVVAQIMADMETEERQLTRYCHRVTPVEKAFKAEFFRMKDAVEQLLAAKTKGEKHSWSLNFKCRNNDKFKYKEVLKTVTDLATQFGHFADIYYPEWTISIEINHHLMCVSILEKFKECKEFKLKKVNVQPLPNPKPLEEASEPEPSNQLPSKSIREEVRKQAEPTVESAVPERDIEKPTILQGRHKQLLTEQIEAKQDDTQLF